MTHEEHGALYEQLASRGVSRRDFLKYCGSLAAMLGLSEAYVPQIASAVALGSELKPAIWLNGGACTGCTESMAQGDYPDVATVVLDILSVNYFETIMMAQGEDAEKSITDTMKMGDYLLIYEGAVMTGEDGNVLRIAGRTGVEVLEEVAAEAEAVIAVGSCAVDGGWIAGRPNSTGGTGVTKFLADKGIDKPIIKLPSCPVNPEWVVAVVVDYLMVERLPELDDFARPVGIYGQTIHDNCPRRGHFENGEFVTEFGSEEEAMGYCLYKVGCKGPQTFTNCPIVRWNSRSSRCVESGSPCIGCGTADPISGGASNWVDMNTPFLNRARGLRIGDSTVQPTTVGLIAGGAVAAGLAIHGLAVKGTGQGKGTSRKKKGGDE